MANNQTISFYSFKGGTGRSTALANVAYALAEEGATVGCLDLDLAAPGLHMIFSEAEKNDDGLNRIRMRHRDKRTVHDFLDPTKGESDIEDYIIDVGQYLDDSLGGELMLIAGKVDTPGNDNPKNMMTESLKLHDRFIDRKDVDYLLIDSRSGLSNHMFPVFDEADHFLAFHKWTPQHRRGTKELAKWIQSTPVTLDKVMSVASNVPDSVAAEEVQEWVRTELFAVSNTHLIRSAEILKGGEDVVTLNHPDSQIAHQYNQLAGTIREL